jgi:glycosyltransferase involved in cell wall biosynthesis
MNGLRRDSKPHIGREKAHEKYMTNSELILTSSNYYADVLKNRFINLKDKIHNNYFGYIKQIDTKRDKKIKSNNLRIAYVGTMGSTQKPELLYEAYKLLKNNNNELYFIGNRSNYSPLQDIDEKNVHFIDFLPHDEFLKFMCENIDVGFVSLTSDYFGACVPSKIYEYINLELPIIGALPVGDGKDIVNNKNYGIACKYDDIEGLTNAIKTFQSKGYIDNIKKNILIDKDRWYMKNTILDVDILLKDLT